MPSYADGIYEGIQLLNGSFGDTSFNLLSYTQIDAKGISLSLICGETGSVEEIRKIYDGKKLIEEISIIDNTVTIKNHLRGYEYKLTKIDE